MSDRVILQWNVVNWVTVVLMVAIAFLVSGTVMAFLKTNLPSAVSASADSDK